MGDRERIEILEKKIKELQQEIALIKRLGKTEIKSSPITSEPRIPKVGR